MKYWLFKSEPNTWSWNDQLKRGDKGEHWDGVRNYQAANNMKSIRLNKNLEITANRRSVNVKRLCFISKIKAIFKKCHGFKKHVTKNSGTDTKTTKS